jgi:hypothetical protein
MHLQLLLLPTLWQLTAASSGCFRNPLTLCAAHLLLLLLPLVSLLSLARPFLHCSSHAAWVLSRRCATSTQGRDLATALQTAAAAAAAADSSSEVNVNALLPCFNLLQMVGRSGRSTAAAADSSSSKGLARIGRAGSVHFKTSILLHRYF